MVVCLPLLEFQLDILREMNIAHTQLHQNRLTSWAKSTMVPVEKETIGLIDELPYIVVSYNTGDSSDFSNIVAQRKALNKDSGKGTSHALDTTTAAPSPRVQDLRTAHPPPRVPRETLITVVPPTTQEKGKRKTFKEKLSSS
ncbi:hypothetical protein V8G54_004936 [Vigna mungo]|uniref:Uncharacterized protein n=1 Tax=Vigna mungo TaxID=3915 RepID=A0AAQ3PIU2_VIGMU